jgi:hypothetical protein
MKALKLAAKRFDYPGFQQAMLDFYRPQLAAGASPKELVMVIDANGCDYLTADDDPVGKLGCGEKLFFIFHSPNDDPNPFQCVDGSVIAVSQLSEKECPDEMAGYGYLLSLNGSKLTISAARASDVGYHAKSGLNCGAFDQPMTSFIKRFIK